jgi:hypothetical protein
VLDFKTEKVIASTPKMGGSDMAGYVQKLGLMWSAAARRRAFPDRSHRCQEPRMDCEHPGAA